MSARLERVFCHRFTWRLSVSDKIQIWDKVYFVPLFNTFRLDLISCIVVVMPQTQLDSLELLSSSTSISTIHHLLSDIKHVWDTRSKWNFGNRYITYTWGCSLNLKYLGHVLLEIWCIYKHLKRLPIGCIALVLVPIEIVLTATGEFGTSELVVPGIKKDP